ncbi:MAG: hypothetical protein ACI9WU_003312 [Myxococcota bacterium]|jgi:uncharacterized protein (DUF924 family)
MADALTEEILTFWLGATDDQWSVDPGTARSWFTKSDDFDGTIRTRFGGHVEAAAKGDYDHWTETARGRLALLLLLDQFTRNIYRDTAKAWAADDKSLAIACQGIELGHDQELRPIERPFMYLPLEHAEDMAMQDHCVELCRVLGEQAPEDAVFCNAIHGYAIRHRDIVARFGRFPHRNVFLGRESTAEEVEFLTKPGSSF